MNFPSASPFCPACPNSHPMSSLLADLGDSADSCQFSCKMCSTSRQKVGAISAAHSFPDCRPFRNWPIRSKAKMFFKSYVF